MYNRLIEKDILSAFKDSNKIIVLLGPRRVGKTTLVQKIFDNITGKKETLNGDYLDDLSLLKPERTSMKNLVSGLDYLFIDEAQNFKEIGRCLKIIHDEFPQVKVVATGSSSFDIKNNLGEPLTGRKITFNLFPINYKEIYTTPKFEKEIYSSMMIYGSYPELLSLSNREEKIDYLKGIVADYLLKDIYSQVNLNKSKLKDLLKLLAFQVGNEVSYNEIASQITLDVKTVQRYIYYLEEAFVVFRLGAYSKNLRKEISKGQKIFFYDCGIRNAIIDSFKDLDMRDDIGGLWENFLISEKIKKESYKRSNSSLYFWRTYDQQEIDLIEENSDKLAAYELKFSKMKAKIPKAWQNAYPGSSFTVVNNNSIRNFLL